MPSDEEKKAARAAYMREWRARNAESERERDRAKYARQKADPDVRARINARASSARLRRLADPGRAPCSVHGCGKPAATSGLCEAHYLRKVRHGDPLAGGSPILPGRVTERVWSRILVGEPDACWPWTAAVNTTGYGVVRGDNGSNTPAYRAAWQSVNGPVPPGLELDHLCRNRLCCNPAHLEPVTHAENMRRARKAVCVNGHEMTEENVKWVQRRGNQLVRVCRACDKVWQHEKYMRRKAKGIAQRQ